MDGLVEGWLNDIAPTMILCAWIYLVKDRTSFSQWRQKYWPYLNFLSTACCKFMDIIIDKIHSSICIGSHVAQFENSRLPSSFHVKHSPNGHSQGSHKEEGRNEFNHRVHTLSCSFSTLKTANIRKIHQQKVS